MEEKGEKREGFFLSKEGMVLIPPEKRKAALERYMALARENPAGPYGNAFFQVGEALAVVYEELCRYFDLGRPAIAVFGRLVKEPACVRLIQEGAESFHPGLKVEAADGELCATPLMKELWEHPVYTVAQFGQAVGAVYFGAA